MSRQTIYDDEDEQTVLRVFKTGHNTAALQLFKYNTLVFSGSKEPQPEIFLSKDSALQLAKELITIALEL